MTRPGFRTLQIGCAMAILGLGALIVWETRTEASAALSTVLLVGIGLLALALGELHGAAAAGKAESAPPARNEEVDAALDRVVRLISDHLKVNHDYNDSITRLSDGLQKLPERSDVQEIIVKLIHNNLKMKAKVFALSQELETSQRQIVSLRRNVTEVGKIAMLDAVTELGNRRYFDRLLQEEIERARATGHQLCLVMADVDRFKSFNDRFGHLVGDHILRLFAVLLGQKIRGKGVAARYGGDEFALLFPGVGIEEATRIIDSIRGELQSKRWVVGAKEENLGAVTASFGIARLSVDDSAETLVRRADDGLFQAKSAGRNRVVASAEKDASAREFPHSAAMTG